jgi:hypothetical protein
MNWLKWYLTKEEYEYYGGKYSLSMLDIVKYNMQFASLIHPNQRMLELFYNQLVPNFQGELVPLNKYPLEVKVAMIVYIEFMIENKSQLEALPIGGSTVGSTSVDYVNGVAENFGALRYRVPKTVKEILKPTNLLSPTWALYNHNRPCLGTIPPEMAVPFEPTQVGVSEVFGQPNSTILHSIKEITGILPSIQMKLYDEVRVMDGAIVTDQVDYVLKHEFIGWVRNREFESNYSASVVIPPQDDDMVDIEVNVGDRIEFTYGDTTTTYSVAGLDKHLDHNGLTHHFFGYLE